MTPDPCGIEKRCSWRVAAQAKVEPTYLCVGINSYGDPCARKAQVWVRHYDPDAAEEMVDEQYIALALCPTHYQAIKNSVVPKISAEIERKLTHRLTRQISQQLSNQPTSDQQRNHKREKRWGRVYFAQRGQRVKIGFSTQPTKRIRDLELAGGASFDRVVTTKGTRALEQKYHRRWDEYRQVGEWFTATTEIIDEMARLAERSTPESDTAS